MAKANKIMNRILGVKSILDFNLKFKMITKGDYLKQLTQQIIIVSLWEIAK